MKRLIFALALPTLLALLAGLAPLVGAQAPAATTKVYLPLVACPGCTGSVPRPSPTPSPTTEPVNPDAFEARIIQLVNEARATVGCPAVTPNASLMQATGDWSAYMARTGDYQHAPSNWYATYDYPSNGVLENISGGDEPEYVFEGWMLSTFHKRNIQWCYPISDPSYTADRIYEIGIGYDGSYWTLAIGDRIP